MQNTYTNNINNNNADNMQDTINNNIIDDSINNISDDSNINKKKNLGGRPKAVIDKKTFEGLCFIQATKEEICAVFNIDEKTLTRWCKDTYKCSFSDILKEKSAGGKISLRRAQWQSAQKGNVVMQIWLGKNWLGQTDKIENKFTGSENEGIKINVNFGSKKSE